MKKAMAYVTTAVLIGFAIMMLPLALETGPPTYQPRLTPQAFSPLTKSEENNHLLPSYGLAAQPSNLLPSSLIFISGLIVALTIYAGIKRRIP